MQNQRKVYPGDKLMTKGLMVAALMMFSAIYAKADGYLIFPHFAAGDGLVSQLTLINPSSDLVRASIYIFNENGTSAKDLPDGTLSVLPAYGVRQIPITAIGPARIGSIQVVYGAAGSDPFPPPLFGSLLITIAGTGSSAVQAGAVGNTFTFPAQRTASLRTGMAIANVCPIPTPAVTVTLRDLNGLPTGSRSLQLPAFGHVSFYVDEFITNAGGLYSGTATVSTQPSSNSCISTLSVTSYDLGAGQFIVLPVARIN